MLSCADGPAQLRAVAKEARATHPAAMSQKENVPRKVGVIAAVVCAVCLVMPFKGEGISFGIAQRSPRLTLVEAITAARRNAKPGSSLTVVREFVANSDTRRIGDQALEEAKARGIKLYKNGVLADVLRLGGFLLAETEPQTNNMIALHLVSQGPGDVLRDALYWSDDAVKLADAQELLRDTTEFAEQLYSTPSSEALSLEGRFYGASFPEYEQSEDYSLFAIPRTLKKVGADQNEYREAAALYGGYLFWSARYALSMPAFAANPAVAENAAEHKRDTLKAEFLRNNHMDPNFDFDPKNTRSKEQLRERIDALRKLDKFMEEALRNEANSALVKANLSVAVIPLGVSADKYGHQVLYGSGMGSLFVIYWQRLPRGGFAVNVISAAG